MCVFLLKAAKKLLTSVVQFVTGEDPCSNILKEVISRLMFRESKPVSVASDRTLFAKIMRAFHDYEITVSANCLNCSLMLHAFVAGRE
jgi:hypothetical protein